MLHLENGGLRVAVLDPVADAIRLGPRYCWGGYVWQVHDRIAGPLLRGPEWPHATPSAFNGQGLPESFRHRTLAGEPLTWQGDEGVALGAGRLHRRPGGEVTLVYPCKWDVRAEADRLRFATRHAAAGFQYELARELALVDRKLCSTTQLTNTSPTRRLALEWFAHPFFPLVDGSVRAEINVGAALPENEGFVLADRILTARRRFRGPDDGHMERGLQLPPGRMLEATLAHPAVADVRFETSFVPDSCIIWGNDRTFSFEPYLRLDLGPGETQEWSLLYRFGASSGIAAFASSSRAPDAI